MSMLRMIECLTKKEGVAANSHDVLSTLQCLASHQRQRIVYTTSCCCCATLHNSEARGSE